MPVRNVSGIGGDTPIPVYHLIPPVDNSIYKITVDNGDEEIDVTELIPTASFNIGVISGSNSTVGDFALEFIDPIKTNYDKISAFNDVYIYGDYGSSATTKRFRFKVESIGYTEDFNTSLSGRGIGMIMIDKSIIYSTVDENGDLVNKAKSTVIQEIIEANFPEITDFSQIEEDTTEVQKNYLEIPFGTIMEELCGDSKYFYLDKDLVPHYFTKGSRINTTEVIGEANKVSYTNNEDTSEDIYTRVRVYGTTDKGNTIIATSVIDTTNTSGINKDYIVTNSSVNTYDQAKELADEYASNLSAGTKIGDIKALYLPTLAEGESMFIGLSENNIAPEYYNISEFTFDIDNNGDYPFTTSATIEKKKTSISTIIKDNIQTQVESVDTDNPYDLDQTLFYEFTTDTGTHDGTEIDTSSGTLQLQDGELTGTWTSPNVELDANVSQIYIKVDGSGLANVSLSYSLTGGSPYTTLGMNSSEVVAGNNIRLRVTINSSSTEITFIGVYYS